MAQPPGTRLGPYEVIALLGAGGMGEVYRARDTRLGREVAIKVLLGDVANDSERHTRFEREARAVAALDHPHICGIYDVGEASGTHYLVMPLLEGHTLAARLEKGPLPIAEALKIAGEIADALDKAHRHGIVHRDLKPANVMLTKAGVKLLDFGLAKLRATGGVVALSSGMHTATTTAGPKSTAEGTILGTIHYMAPEQVEGKDADHRADIWALGAVIYEMVTGARPFQGATAASIMGAILKDTPAPLANRQPLTSPALSHIVDRCLAKDPDERWQSAGDIKHELSWSAHAVPSAAPSDSRRSWPWLAATALGAAAASLLAFAGVMRDSGAPVAPQPDALKFEVVAPRDAVWSPSPVALTAQVALSHDGTQLAFVAARKGESSRVWIRPLNRLDAQPVPGTEGATFPFWSPDGRFVAFFAAGKLKKVDIALGTPQTLCDVPAGRGGSWSTDGTILFAQSVSPLFRVPADGGPVTPATAFDAAQEPAWHYWPHFLPDGRRFIYLQRSTKPGHQGIYLASLDSAQTARLVDTDVRASFASGHLFFMRDGLLFAQALDERTLQLAGEPVRIAGNIGYYGSAFGYAAFDTSHRGVIALGPPLPTVRQLQSFTREGQPLGRALEGAFAEPRLSSNGDRLLLSIRDPKAATADVWLMELARGSLSRVTSDPSTDYFGTWMPDGERVAFATTRVPSSQGANVVYQRTLNGVGGDEPLDPTAPVRGFPDDVSRDGTVMLVHQLTTRGYDIQSVTLLSAGNVADFVATPFNEVQARFSPDGRWVAYASDESGRFEVYVRAFPSGGDRTPISIAGGMQPEWRRDGKELFFLAADGELMAVPMNLDGPSPKVGTPNALFGVEVAEPAAPYPNDYAVSADGQRFFVTSTAKQTSPTLTLILNWTAALGSER